MARSSRLSAVAGSIALAAAFAVPSAPAATNVALHFNHVHIPFRTSKGATRAGRRSNWAGYAKTGSGFSKRPGSGRFRR